jgi:putative redox protein
MKPQTDFQVTFDGHAGSRRAGWIRLPQSSAQGWALIAHFLLESASGPATTLAHELAKHGIGSLRVDLGALQPDGPAWEVEDLVKAAAFAERSLGPIRILVGHGIAGAALLAASGAMEGVACIATIGAPHRSHHVRRLLVATESEGAHAGHLAGRSFRLSPSFLSDLDAQDALGTIASPRRALLVVHGAADAVIPPSDAVRIAEAARCERRVVIVPGADHLLSNSGVAAQVTRLIAGWAAEMVSRPSWPPGTSPCAA